MDEEINLDIFKGEKENDGEVDIFERVPEPDRPNYFKFEKIGDSIQGTYVGRNDNSVNSYGAPQTLVTLKMKDGENMTVSIRHSKIGLLKVLDTAKFGQIIGFKFTGEKANPGKQATKFIRLAHDPSVVDEEWLKENEGKYTNPTPMNPTPAAAPITTTANVPASDNEAKIKQIISLAKTKLGAVDEESVKSKIMEKTGLAFINVNLDLILDRLNTL